jgi:hypothetical protein
MEWKRKENSEYSTTKQNKEQHGSNKNTHTENKINAENN